MIRKRIYSESATVNRSMMYIFMYIYIGSLTDDKSELHKATTFIQQ